MNSSNASLVIAAPDPKKDFDAMLEMTGVVFRPDNPAGWVSYCKAGYFTGSSYDYAASRVAFLDGRLVSHVGVWRLKLAIGRARLAFGGIGAVGTYAECRGRGIASKVMKAVMEAMRAEGYAMSCMFGRRDFYGRYGYKPVFSRGVATIQLDQMPEPQGDGLAMESADVTDLINARGELGAIYRRQRKHLSLSAERPVFTLNRYDDWRLHVFRDAGSKLRAYLAVSVDGEELVVHEAGGYETPAQRRQLVELIGRTARHYACASVRLSIPRSHPLMTVLKRMDCTYTDVYYRDGNAMAAVVNLPAALRALRPQLQAHLDASPLAGESFDLNLAAAGQQAGLSARAGRIAISARPIEQAPEVAGDDMPRLLLGSEPPREVVEAGAMRCTRGAAELLDVLFPATDPRLPDAEYH